MEYFWDGFEKRAKSKVKITDDEMWKSKWHPEGKERAAVHSAIHAHLKKNKKRLNAEGREALQLFESGKAHPSHSMWHPRFLTGQEGHAGYPGAKHAEEDSRMPEAVGGVGGMMVGTELARKAGYQHHGSIPIALLTGLGGATAAHLLTKKKKQPGQQG